MNFRNCQYFLTVCEMGTMGAAARKLYISQQSLSENIRKLEKELGVTLFHRDNPLTLTQAGRVFYQTSSEILASLDRMDKELAIIKGQTPDTLIVGCVDYGTPDFIPALVELFLKKCPNVLITTREFSPLEDIPRSISILISARELRGYKCENLFSDELIICVKDSLLEKVYGAGWKAHKEAAQKGDLSAIEKCPFIRMQHTPLEHLADLVFEKNDFRPDFLPVTGSTSAMAQLCATGQGALVTFLGQAQNNPLLGDFYHIPNIPSAIPTSYICYPADRDLTEPERVFLEITRRFFKHWKKNA